MMYPLLEVHEYIYQIYLVDIRVLASRGWHEESLFGYPIRAGGLGRRLG